MPKRHAPNDELFTNTHTSKQWRASIIACVRLILTVNSSWVVIFFASNRHWKSDTYRHTWPQEQELTTERTKTSSSYFERDGDRAIIAVSSEPAFKVVNWYLENIFKWTSRSSSCSRCGTRTRVEWEFQSRYVGDPFRDDHHYCEESAAGWFMIQALDTVRMLRIWNWLRLGMFWSNL